MSFSLLRQGPCPSCGAPIEFRTASSAAQVCKHCGFVVARTDRDFRAIGKVAELVAIHSPFGIGASGTLGNRQFVIEGKVQYDRASAPGAPWEEFHLSFSDGTWSWLAHAQGRFYLTQAIPTEGMRLPGYREAVPGVVLNLPHAGAFQITEQGARRALSGQGELPFVINPNAPVEYYADLSGPNGGFGTLDFGNGQKPPVLFVGAMIDPNSLKLSSGAAMLAEAPKVAMQSLVCPGCGGNLPLMAPDRAERIVCKYCGTASNVNEGALKALGRVPKPPEEPIIPLGTEGTIRGRKVTVIGFVVRFTEDDEGRYYWREYLLYSGGEGFFWLLEENKQWEFIETLHIGNVEKPNESSRNYQGGSYRQVDESINATVACVVGEFYWRVEIGETVLVTNFNGPVGQKLSEERGAGEILLSHSSPLPPSELAQAFPSAIKAKDWKGAATGAPSMKRVHLFWGALLVVWMIISVMGCSNAQNALVFDKQIAIPPAGTPTDKLDHSLFTDTFTVVRGGRSLDITLSAPNLNNNWLGADVALVNLDSGDVWEDSFTLEFYSGTASGVDEGEAWTENWTEGDRSKTLSYSRIPEGKYVFRMDPSFDGTTPPTNALAVNVRSDTPPVGSSVFVFFGLVTLWFLTWLFARIFKSTTR